jgi:hypothetical protein
VARELNQSSEFFDSLIELIESGDYPTDLRKVLTSDVNLWKKFLDQFKYETFVKSSNLPVPKKRVEELVERLEKLTRYFRELNADDLDEDATSEVESRVREFFELVGSLLHLRTIVNVRSWKCDSFLFFLEYYLNRREVLSRYFDPSVRIKAPIGKPIPDDGGGSFGGSFNLTNNFIEIYSYNLFIHLEPAIFHLIILHEVGHFYLSYLREVYKHYEETGSLKEAFEKLFDDFKGFQRERWGKFLNLFEDLRVEKFMYDNFRVVQKAMQRFGDFVRGPLFTGRVKAWRKTLDHMARNGVEDESEIRMIFLLNWGIYLRFFVNPEGYGLKNEDEAWKLMRTVPGFDEKFWKDAVEVARKVANAIELSEVADLLKKFHDRWFPKPEEDFSHHESRESAPGRGSEASGTGSETGVGTDSENSEEKSSEKSESGSGTGECKLGGGELGGEEGGTAGKSESGKEGLNPEERGAFNDDFLGRMVSELEKMKEQGEDFLKKLSEIFEESDESSESESRVGESEFKKRADEFMERLGKKLDEEVKRTLDEVERKTEEIERKQDLDFSKRVSDDVKDVVQNFTDENRFKSPGAGILNSIAGEFSISKNDSKFFHPTSELRTDLVNEMARAYTSGVLFVRHVVKRCKTGVAWQEEKTGTRLNVRSYARKLASDEFSARTGIRREVDYLSRMERVEKDLPVRRMDLVVDTSGSMSVVEDEAKWTIAYFMGMADELSRVTKGRFDFRIYCVRGHSENYLLNFRECLKNPRKYGMPGVVLASLLAMTAGREGFSAYVRPFLNPKEGRLFDARKKPFLVFVLTDAHFVSQEDWKVVEKLKQKGEFFTCGIYCKERGSEDEQVVNNLTQAFDGYFVGTRKNVKRFVEEFLKVCFKKEENRKITRKDLTSILNKLKVQVDYDKILKRNLTFNLA